MTPPPSIPAPSHDREHVANHHRHTRSHGRVRDAAVAETPSEIHDETVTPLISFGMITDVQYADVIDGWNYSRTTQRFYRHALTLLQRAVQEWVHVQRTTRRASLQFAVDLGDLIDGKNRPAGTTEMALQRTLAACLEFERQVGPMHHIVGNHELYNLSQHAFNAQLRWKQAPTTQAYYDFTTASTTPSTTTAAASGSPSPSGVRFVVLNCYGVTTLGRSPDDPIYQDAHRRLRAENDNDDLNSPLGLHREARRFVAYNGAVDQAQLTWLARTLRRARQRQEHVVVFTHVPIHPRSCPHNCLLWNYDDVLRVLADHAPCVRAVFSGHVHANGYARDRNGVHYVVNAAVLECEPPKETAHAIVDVHEDRIVVNGYGRIPSRVLHFRRGTIPGGGEVENMVGGEEAVMEEVEEEWEHQEEEEEEEQEEAAATATHTANGVGVEQAMEDSRPCGSKM